MMHQALHSKTNKKRRILRDAALPLDSPLRNELNLEAPTKASSKHWKGFAIYDPSKVHDKSGIAVGMECFAHW
jgi:hypothetical protein